MQCVMHAYLFMLQVASSPGPAQKLGGAWGRGEYTLIHVCTQYALRSGEL